MAAPIVGSIPRMRRPMTYVIDYGRQFIDDPETIRAFADAPPDLMHVGKTVPILHNWGPARVYWGENQVTGETRGKGVDREWTRLLTPEELDQRIERIKRYTKAWHDAGVPLLMPYSSIHTIAGDHETRDGFWAFFDRWDDYARWLGPRPEHDPVDWLMRDREGGIVPGACGGLSPSYYAPLHRYRCCSENPDWRRWQERLTELIAEVGYDGVFPDNSSIHDVCFCKYCREGFRRFCATLDEREREMFGVADPDDADLLGDDTPAELIRRYRIDTCSRYQEWIRAAGRKVNPDFLVFPNINSFEVFMPISSHCDYLMFESTYTPGCVISGVPKDDPFATVAVADDAGAGRTIEFFASAVRTVENLGIGVRVEYPDTARTGAPVELKATVEKLGSRYWKAGWADGFEFILTDLENGREERLPLEPAAVVGLGEQKPEIQPPPVSMAASWTPAKAGRYRLEFAYLSTNKSDDDLAEHRTTPCRCPMNWGALYQTHVGQFMFTMHAGARTISLDYDVKTPGRETAMELSLAEGAAFSNGSTVAATGEPLSKYAAFFRKRAGLYEDFLPWADIGLLYSYWGSNPDTLELKYASQVITPSVDLAARHRLFEILMDRTINEADLAGLRTLILAGHALEMDEAQIEALRAFRDRGGALYVYRKDTTINDTPCREVLGEATAWSPGENVPGVASLIAAEGLARGLRLSAFVHPEDRRMTLHALNYNIALREPGLPATPVETTAVSLPLPARWRVAAVKVHDPDVAEVEDVDFAQDASTLKFALPTVRIYKVVEIQAG